MVTWRRKIFLKSHHDLLEREDAGIDVGMAGHCYGVVGRSVRHRQIRLRCLLEFGIMQSGQSKTKVGRVIVAPLGSVNRAGQCP